MTNRESLIRKVRALLAKAHSTDGEEAMAFLAKVQTWVVEHQITEAELTATSDHEFVTLAQPALTVWQERVNLAVAKLYFCAYFELNVGDRVLQQFCGEEHHVVVAKAMADYIIETIERMASPGRDQRTGEDARLYDASFCEQASVVIGMRIKERILDSMGGRVKGSGTKNLPALVDAYVSAQTNAHGFLVKHYGAGYRERMPSLKRHHPQGLDDGQTAGEAIGLEPQVAASKRRRLQ
jgi:hypothetical protein